MYNFGKTDEFPAGPWQDEPDKAQWVDEATNLDCLMVRNPMGALCGYVGVPREHPWYGKGYSECTEGCGNSDITRRESWLQRRAELLADEEAMKNPFSEQMIESMDLLTEGDRGDEPDYCFDHSPESKIRVHGGITFADSCQEDREEGICHVPAPGRPHDIWWFGFDCNHYQDASPYDYKRAESKEYPWYPVDGTYRPFEYVQKECADMAQQLAAVTTLREPMTS